MNTEPMLGIKIYVLVYGEHNGKSTECTSVTVFEILKSHNFIVNQMRSLVCTLIEEVSFTCN